MPPVPCSACVSGTLTDQTPTGTEATIHGLSTYVALPDGESKGLIIFIPDAFGWKLPNNRVLADNYAKKGGFTVYIPDFMDGIELDTKLLNYMNFITTPASWYSTIVEKPFYAVQVAYQFIPFLIWCREAVTKPRVFKFAKALRTSPDTANLKIGAAGFCWGGPYAIKLAHDAPSTRVHRPGSEGGEVQPLIDAAFVAHPSMLKVPADINPVTVPLSIVIGDRDFAMSLADVEKTKAILEKKGDDHEVVIYPGAKHGFTIRSDPTDLVQKELADEAEVHAMKWFSKWL